MRVVGALLGVLFALVASAPARAGELTLSGTEWTFVGEEVPDKISIDPVVGDPTRFSLTDDGNPITVDDPHTCGSGTSACCSQSPATLDKVICRRLDRLIVRARSGDDTVKADSTLDYDLILNGEGGADQLIGGMGNDTLNAGSGDDTALSGQGGDDELFGGTGADKGIAGGPGADTLSYDDGRSGGVTASLGGANSDGDTFTAAPSIEILRGSDRGDVLTGTAGVDTLLGAGGDDTLIGASGADTLIGSSGHDIASYADGRAAGVSATLGGTNSDGDAYTTIEGLAGGAGADTLTGDAMANTLDGGSGQDVLTGAAGDDTIRALDDGADLVDCGSGTDTAFLDFADVAQGCEVIRHADADADGFEVPDDCNDANPAINPGATEIPDNGVDDNCDGTFATTLAVVPDGDHDGFNSQLDCNDANAAIHPGALEIPGNAVDENCDRLRPDFPVSGASVTIFVSATRRSALITELTLNAVPAGARAEIRCRPPRAHKKACPFKVVRRTFKRAHRKLKLTSVFKHRRLPVGTQVTVRLRVPRAFGPFRQVTVVPRGLHSVRRCLKPGAARPRVCPLS